MKSETTDKFRALFARAPDSVKRKIREAHHLWLENPDHRSLRFKKIHAHLPIFSARVDLDWRAVGVLRGDTVIWFWVGPHDQYAKLIGQL